MNVADIVIRYRGEGFDSGQKQFDNLSKASSDAVSKIQSDAVKMRAALERSASGAGIPRRLELELALKPFREAESLRRLESELAAYGVNAGKASDANNALAQSDSRLSKAEMELAEAIRSRANAQKQVDVGGTNPAALQALENAKKRVMGAESGLAVITSEGNAGVIAANTRIIASENAITEARKARRALDSLDVQSSMSLVQWSSKVQEANKRVAQAESMRAEAVKARVAAETTSKSIGPTVSTVVPGLMRDERKGTALGRGTSTVTYTADDIRNISATSAPKSRTGDRFGRIGIDDDGNVSSFRMRNRIQQSIMGVAGLGEGPLEAIAQKWQYLDFMAKRYGTTISGLVAKAGPGLGILAGVAVLYKGLESTVKEGAKSFDEAGLSGRGYWSNLAAGLGIIDTWNLKHEKVAETLDRLSANYVRLKENMAFLKNASSADSGEAFAAMASSRRASAIDQRMSDIIGESKSIGAEYEAKRKAVGESTGGEAVDLYEEATGNRASYRQRRAVTSKWLRPETWITPGYDWTGEEGRMKEQSEAGLQDKVEVQRARGYAAKKQAEKLQSDLWNADIEEGMQSRSGVKRYDAGVSRQIKDIQEQFKGKLSVVEIDAKIRTIVNLSEAGRMVAEAVEKADMARFAGKRDFIQEKIASMNPDTIRSMGGKERVFATLQGNELNREESMASQRGELSVDQKMRRWLNAQTSRPSAYEEEGKRSQFGFEQRGEEMKSSSLRGTLNVTEAIAYATEKSMRATGAWQQALNKGTTEAQLLAKVLGEASEKQKHFTRNVLGRKAGADEQFSEWMEKNPNANDSQRITEYRRITNDVANNQRRSRELQEEAPDVQDELARRKREELQRTPGKKKGKTAWDELTDKKGKVLETEEDRESRVRGMVKPEADRINRRVQAFTGGMDRARSMWMDAAENTGRLANMSETHSVEAYRNRASYEQKKEMDPIVQAQLREAIKQSWQASQTNALLNRILSAMGGNPSNPSSGPVAAGVNDS